MEDCTKALIIRSPSMGGLKYIIANLNGVITLVVPEWMELDRLGESGEKGINPGSGERNEAVISVGIDELVKVLTKTGFKKKTS